MTSEPYCNTPRPRTNYVWDEPLHLFRRAEVQDFAYSDGEEVERRLLDAISKTRDRSTFSEELSEFITDWPSEYHLSRSRHCLLRPLGIRAGDKVLEVGCGCGAITRFLGELGADVLALEGSMRRARVAAERCRDLVNVQVVVDDLLRFETDERFDWILLIGVLEYAAVLAEHDSPFQHCLRSASQFLAPDGKVVVAIENKLGLKYFNSCGEDHLGVPFFGVQDLYQDRAPRTFGRRELIEQLWAAGLPNLQFNYPFPDYKLPSVILSESALADSEFDPVDLLARCYARDYSGWALRGFDDALAFSAVAKNGLLAELSNSFLVVATSGSAVTNDAADIATTFSATHRPAEFATQTRFLRREGKLLVVKERLTAVAAPPCVKVGGTTIWNVLADSEYYPGRQLLWGFLRARARSGGIESIVQALRPWVEFLLKHARPPADRIADSGGQPTSVALFTVPGDFLDCTPFNLMNTPSGLVYFDAEWKSEGGLPLGWILTRGVVHSLAAGLPSVDQSLSIAEVVEALCGSFAISVSRQEIQGWLDQESDFQCMATGRVREEISAEAKPGGRMRALVGEIARLTGEVVGLTGEVVARDSQNARIREEARAFAQERDHAHQERDHARQERDHAGQERNHARQERDHARQERDHARQERDQACQERDHARADANAVREHLNRVVEHFQHELQEARQDTSRYKLAYEEVSNLIIPMRLRRSVPESLKRPLRALKRVLSGGH